jgi:flagellum-specific peptidoglycan hydrolase FlgJ
MENYMLKGNTKMEKKSVSGSSTTKTAQKRNVRSTKYFLIPILFLLLILSSFTSSFAQTPEAYIQKYAGIAQDQMRKYGVPASITLAQGILESGSGKSKLAAEANNHFGIKCHDTWSGATMHIDDDAPNECFRKYKSVEQSFEDHSIFLKKPRYEELFALEITDYKGWAQGLKKCGYATSPTYAKNLIDLIEKHELTKFDTEQKPNEHSAIVNISNNRIKYVSAKKKESLADLSKRTGIAEHLLAKYNDLEDGHEFKEKEIVYLQPKRFKGSVKEHKVKRGENIRDISQQYGIRIRSIERKNKLEHGAELKTGTVLKLR